jgi:RNA polymerase sigma-70 factor (sigma-E family)
MTGGAGWAGLKHPSLADLYRQHSPAALRLAYLLTGEPHLAQDLVQDAFVRLFGRYRDLRDAKHFEAYLRRTIVNLAKDEHRKRSREQRHRGHEGAVTTPAPDVDNGLRDALMELPQRQRAALALRYLEDLSEQQTADIMNTSVAAVKSLTQRGAEALRRHLGGGAR